MSRHCKNLRALTTISCQRDQSKMLAESPFDLHNRLPLGSGWHRLTISGVGDAETIELRLDFGLGFIGHHSVRATAERGAAELFVRLFKPVRAVQLLREAPARDGRPVVALRKVTHLQLWAWRALEQFHISKKALCLRGPNSGSRHDQPRRLWGWRGFQAFPAELAARGASGYALWRHVTRDKTISAPRNALDDWLLVMDCRAAQPRTDCLEALANAAAYVGARAHLLRDGELTAPTQRLGKAAQWTVLVEPDIALDRDCVAAFSEAAKATEQAAVLYCDSDYADETGARLSPELRTSFSIERLRSQDWLGGVLAFRADVLIRHGAGTSTAHALCLGIAEALGPRVFAHIPTLLYSRRSSPARPTPDRRIGLGKWSGRTTVIIPTRNRADLLQRCVSSILDRTVRHPPQIIIYDNASDDPAALALLERYAAQDNVRVMRNAEPFNFSRINNEASALADGDLLLFLNNDTEVLSADWIEVLGDVAADPSVGCAGPLLLHPDGTIQHAGLVTGPGGIAAHLHMGLDPRSVDIVAPIVRRDVSAVTGACLAIEKSKFVAVGKFDAHGLPIAFNDLDLCLRLEHQGLRNVFVPEVTLIHMGSATREADDFTKGSDRFRAEFRLMRERWHARLDHDPYFPDHMRLTASGPQLRLA